MRTVLAHQSRAGTAHAPHASLASRTVFMGFIAFLWLLLASVAAGDDQGPWIRPQNAGEPLIWGRRDGILFGLPSEGGLPGPRGLVRVGVFSTDTGRPQLLNFIAIEPVVLGPGKRFDRMAFSELERSTLDGGIAGKRLWVDPATDLRGVLSTVAEPPKRIERLSVRIDVEQFAANGARVYLIASIDSDRPGERGRKPAAGIHRHGALAKRGRPGHASRVGARPARLLVQRDH